ncbi:putative metal-dependent hydrolase [Pontibacter qinzhouensis]|uniref:Putative metal-dependent hydrolase n=1 Tax=Pontibacter qinzhouensis TaxID=2603253 RepID=A0A5C8KCA8_9BACT|nr:putative metal-dependent hydrolase [Pontibacter qinzhouensis]TXK48058.1 putative metal-dependent hydrolase [Pontibacter qinzhouensis]
MTEAQLEQLKYPVGKWQKPEPITPEHLKQYMATIALFPDKLRKQVALLTAEQLDTPYRPGGWTLRQVVHHCADSHLNSFMRFKLALTEEKPTIKPYYEERWAELPDAKAMAVEPSLLLLDGLHARWTRLLTSLKPDQFASTFTHPQQQRDMRLDETLSLYAWHCRHHLAHITTLKARQGWA